MQPACRVACTAIAAACAILQMPTLALGFTVDARRLAMGGVVITGCQELLALNVAYHSVPARPGVTGVVVPIPLGVVQLVQDPPSFDPDADDFSVTRLANLALNPPFYLELDRPSDLDGDISIRIARNEFAIDFEDASALLPQKPFEVGGVWSMPMFGTALGPTRTYLAPLTYLEGELAFDDAFYAVLAQGQPLEPNSTYRLNARGESLGGFSLHSGWSAPLVTDVRGNGLYAGVFAKYILGIGMSHATSEFAMSTADTIFGESNSLAVDYAAELRYGEFGHIGNGYGVDAGLGVRVGAFDIGLGVRDVGARIHWSRTRLYHSVWDETNRDLQTTLVARDQPFVQNLPTQGTFNIGWMSRKTALAADVSTSRLGTLVHLGAERRTGPLALRAGMLTDYDTRVQWAAGFGIGGQSLSFDVALQTHNRSFTGERGLMLATSFALR